MDRGEDGETLANFGYVLEGSSYILMATHKYLAYRTPYFCFSSLPHDSRDLIWLVHYYIFIMSLGACHTVDPE